MNYQTIFERYELKYLLTKKQKDEILRIMRQYMSQDQYGKSTVRNIYFDTDSYRLIRRSVEGPAYKEKLRIRSYSQVKPDETVFVELKKKYKSVVYKRRLPLTCARAMKCFSEEAPLPERSQIADEIDYFRDFYGSLKPTMFISYDREAFYALDRSDFRVTFDSDIRARQDNMLLSEPAYGTLLLDAGLELMEIKTSGGIPLWMSHFLTSQHIFKTPFSKYGTAYQQMILSNNSHNREGKVYA